VTDRDTHIARRYHEETKHSLQNLQSDRRGLDWANEPLPFKIYVELEPIPLTKELPSSGKTVFDALENISNPTAAKTISGPEELAYILYYTAGVTKKMDIPGRKLYFRAPASAGALYPVEVYVVCKDMEGLGAGVYHFSPADFSLRQLRQGDYRHILFTASGEDPALRAAPAVLVFTGFTWRSAWKYRARSYRYHYWDCGVMLANSLAACGALGLPAKVVMGFVDDMVDHLIGIDGKQEKSLCLFPIGQDTDSSVEIPTEGGIDSYLPSLDLDVVPLSSSQVDYPIIQTMHDASGLQDTEEVKSWKQPLALNWEAENGVRIEPLPEAEIPDKPLEDVIVKRGSSRRFKKEPISFYELSSLLGLASIDLPADWLQPGTGSINRMYLSIHAVDELEPGAYVYHPHTKTLHGLKPGSFRGDSAAICLGQDLGGDASAGVYFLADLETVLGHFGNRGYRVAQMEAGILGGLLYLGAYALNRGASGLTFFDDMMVDFFRPHANGLDAVFVTVLGVPEKTGGLRGRIRRVNPGEKANLEE
jgi:SagB-type dehydrogenase family enzyme